MGRPSVRKPRQKSCQPQLYMLIAASTTQAAAMLLFTTAVRVACRFRIKASGATIPLVAEAIGVAIPAVLARDREAATLRGFCRGVALIFANISSRAHPQSPRGITTAVAR